MLKKTPTFKFNHLITLSGWLIITIMYGIFWGQKSGDAAVYFPFFKNFFFQPFAFYQAKNSVAYGATSPLYVILNAPIWGIVPNHFNIKLVTSKILNLFFILLGTEFCKKIFIKINIAENNYCNLLLYLLVALNFPLLISANQLFEIALVFFLISTSLYAFYFTSIRNAVGLWSLLPLARPELILVSAFLFLYKFFSEKNSPKKTQMFILYGLYLFIPISCYLIYMAINTGTFVPTSVYARYLQSIESPASWSTRFQNSIGFLLNDEHFAPFSGIWHYLNTLFRINFINLFCFFIVVIGSLINLFRPQTANSRITVIFLLSVIFILIMPFIIYPPESYTSRYLLNAFSPLLLLTVYSIQQFNNTLILYFKNSKIFARVANFHSNLLPLLINIFLVWMLLEFAKCYFIQPTLYDYDTILFKPLSQLLEKNHLNKSALEENHILCYEAQGQYYLPGKVYSLDGIVGDGKIFKVLLGQQNLSDFIKINHINYIITLNAFNYRHIYAHTWLVQLYIHDLNHPVGSVFKVDGLLLKKIMTNPAFANPKLHNELTIPNLNYGNSVRVYNEKQPLWYSNHIAWNSVYEVIDTSSK